MLETVREFAAEHREDRAELERAPRGATSSTTPSARPAGGARADRRAWLARLARERGNLRVAFERLLRAGEAEDALRIAIAFARALPWDAHAHEVRGWLAQALTMVGPEPSRAARHGAVLGRGARALPGALRGRRGAAARRRSTRRGTLGDPALEAAVLTALGRRAVLTADPSRPGCARPRWPIARAHRRSRAARRRAARARRARASAPQDWERAAAVADEALALYREADDPYGVAGALGEQGFYDIVHGRLERSEQRLSEALDLRRQLGDDRRLVEPLIDNAWLDLARGSGEVGAARLPRLPRPGAPRRRSVQRRRGARGALLAWPRSTAATSRPRGSPAPPAAIHERIGAPAWESLTRDPRARARARSRRARRGGVRGVVRRGPPAPARRRPSAARAASPVPPAGPPTSPADELRQRDVCRASAVLDELRRRRTHRATSPPEKLTLRTLVASFAACHRRRRLRRGRPERLRRQRLLPQDRRHPGRDAGDRHERRDRHHGPSSWGAENLATIGTATGGAGAGKAQFNELTIEKAGRHHDAAAPPEARHRAS